jgi:hypothetical protein
MTQQSVNFTAVEIVASSQRLMEATAEWEQEQELQHQLSLIASHLDTHGDITQVISALGSIAATAIGAHARQINAHPVAVLNAWARELMRPSAS